MPRCYLAGVRGSRTHLPRSSRGITDLKSVAVRVTSNHQPLYVPQSRLECTNAFHQTAGDANPFVDDIVDGNWLWIPSRNRCPHIARFPYAGTDRAHPEGASQV